MENDGENEQETTADDNDKRKHRPLKTQKKEVHCAKEANQGEGLKPPVRTSTDRKGG